MAEKKDERKGKIQKISMKAKLILSVLPVIVVVLSVLVVFSYSISSDIIEERSAELLESSTSWQRTSIESWLDENLEGFNMVKRLIEQTSPSDEQLLAILNGTAGYEANYAEGVYVGDVTGRLWKSADSTKSAANIQEATWFKEGLSRLHMRYGTVYQNEAGDSLVSASAILNDGAPALRVISADVSLQRIMVIVNSFVQMNDAEAFMVNTRDKTIMAHRDSSLVSTKLDESNSDPYLAAVAKRIKERDYSRGILDGNLTVFDDVAGTDWVLVSFVPRDIIFANVKDLRNKMILISILAILVLVVITERCIHQILKPVKNLTGNIVAMSDGDFTIDVKTAGADEIGKMGRSVSDFIVSIRSMLHEIRSISERVRTQSANTNEVTGGMYDIAEQQADSMQELNVTVDNLSNSIHEIAESATRLAEVVADTKSTSEAVENHIKETVSISEKGKQDMQQVSVAMDNISSSIASLDEAIGKVGQASNEITDIVAVIGSIAEETNLLSLNASIEAARAGEKGKGFAVVASEIGHLADTSAESVNNIVTLINEITRLVQETVSQAQVSMESINESSSMIHTALGTFDTIFEDIHNTSDMIAQMMVKVDEVNDVAANVAAISEEQAASTEQIHRASENMTEQANNIAVSSKEVLSDAQELSKDAKQLSEQLQKFKID